MALIAKDMPLFWRHRRHYPFITSQSVQGGESTWLSHTLLHYFCCSEITSCLTPSSSPSVSLWAMSSTLRFFADLVASVDFLVWAFVFLGVAGASPAPPGSTTAPPTRRNPPISTIFLKRFWLEIKNGQMRSKHRGSDVDPRGVGVGQARCLGDFVVVGLEFGVFHDEKLRRGGMLATIVMMEQCA